MFTNHWSKATFPGLSCASELPGTLVTYTTDSESGGLGGLGLCISNKLPDKAQTTGPRITLGFARAQVFKRGKERCVLKERLSKFKVEIGLFHFTLEARTRTNG